MGFVKKGNELLVLSVFVLICIFVTSVWDFVLEGEANMTALGAGCMLFVIGLGGHHVRNRKTKTTGEAQQ
jgi:hypothetical protein